MIDLAASFVLPLMHHLVKQSVNGLVPSVPADMIPADHYLCCASVLAAPRIMTETALQSPRYSDWNLAQLAIELLAVETRMPIRQLVHVLAVGGMRFLGRATRPRLCPQVRGNPISEKHPSRDSSLAPRASLNEIDNSPEYGLGCIEKATVYAHLSCRKAYDDRSVLSQPYSISRIQTELYKSSLEIVSISRARLQLECKLKLVRAKPDQSAERSKQR